MSGCKFHDGLDYRNSCLSVLIVLLTTIIPRVFNTRVFNTLIKHCFVLSDEIRLRLPMPIRYFCKSLEFQMKVTSLICPVKNSTENQVKKSEDLHHFQYFYFDGLSPPAFVLC